MARYLGTSLGSPRELLQHLVECTPTVSVGVHSTVTCIRLITNPIVSVIWNSLAGYTVGECLLGGNCSGIIIIFS